MATLARHGTQTRYSQGCRCGHCKHEKTYRQKVRRYRQLKGQPNPLDRVDATAAVAALDSWRAEGWTARDIAKATELDWDYLRQILSGRRRPRFMFRRTADAITAVAQKGIRQALQERRREEHAARRVDVLRLVINGHGYESAAARIGIDDRQVHRYLREAGLAGKDMTYAIDRNLQAPTRAGWRRRLEMAAAIDRYLAGECTAYEVVRSFGMMTGRYWTRTVTEAA